ncbi:MAG: PilZ domain-containing protein [Bryobacteraceae bacterium]
MPAKEQRESRWFDITLPVELTQAGSRHLSDHLQTHNVSANSVLMSYPSVPIEVGQEVEYFVTLPTVQTPGMIVRLHCLGHVVRRDADQDTLTASIERYEFVSHPQTSCHAA